MHHLLDVSKDVRALVRAPKTNAYKIWRALHSQFRDNELHRAVYLEAEFRNLVQGDMDITTYTARLKYLADALRDVGQPVRKTSQVLNLIRGLSSKYRHAVPTIITKDPPHTFLSARSYLLLEEQYDKEHAKSEAHHALVTTGASQQADSNSGGSKSLAPTTSDGGSHTGNSNNNSSGHRPHSSGYGAPRSDNHRNYKKQRGRGRGGQINVPRPQGGAWTPGFNPWTGMVHTWPMPFCPPASSVPGPRPGAPVNQAYYAAAPPPPTAPTPDVWNHQAMLVALTTSGIAPSSPQAAEWYFDTGASSHMSSNAGNFTSSQPLLHSPSITVGNGTSLPVTHRASTTIPTARSPLHLNNVLISPSLVKNLISVHSLTRDNNVTVEFDPFGFPIKDLPTRTEILRCNSSGELYPLASSSPSAMVATAPTMTL
jgi:hypothetical protein